jgi:hypothetical protein
MDDSSACICGHVLTVTALMVDMGEREILYGKWGKVGNSLAKKRCEKMMGIKCGKDRGKMGDRFIGKNQEIWWETLGLMVGQRMKYGGNKEEIWWEKRGNMVGKERKYDGKREEIWWEKRGNMMGKERKYDGKRKEIWWHR